LEGYRFTQKEEDKLSGELSYLRTIKDKKEFHPFLIERVDFPESWERILRNNNFLLTELYNACKEAWRAADKMLVGKRRKIIAGLCIPVSILFFVLIFITGNISVIWGTIICVAIILEIAFAVVKSNGLESKTFYLISGPILGGIGGLIVGFVVWLFSSFQTFSMVLWIIAMLILDAVAIFAFSDESF